MLDGRRTMVTERFVSRRFASGRIPCTFPAYSVKTQASGAKRLGGETPRRRTDEGAKRPV